MVSSRMDGPWAVVEVQGEVDMFTAPKLREKLVQTVEEGCYRIVVDLQGVSFMDSTGLGTLVGGLKRVKEHEGTLALVCTSRPVLRVLSITGLNNVFPVYDSVEQAKEPG
ncbi:MAG TPA: STAS domain-containing protein [Actinomycetota bacterium]|nr:STAS domain-containing protein [Actinomycetota bacterium]